MPVNLRERLRKEFSAYLHMIGPGERVSHIASDFCSKSLYRDWNSAEAIDDLVMEKIGGDKGSWGPAYGTDVFSPNILLRTIVVSCEQK